MRASRWFHAHLHRAQRQSVAFVRNAIKHEKRRSGTVGFSRTRFQFTGATRSRWSRAHATPERRSRTSRLGAVAEGEQYEYYLGRARKKNAVDAPAHLSQFARRCRIVTNASTGRHKTQSIRRATLLIGPNDFFAHFKHVQYTTVID